MKTYNEFLNERMKSMGKFNKKVIQKLKLLVPVEQLQQDTRFTTETSTTYKVLGTKFGGELSISIHHDTSSMYSIFMRFEDPTTAKQVVDCNPFSGKWNIHTMDEQEALDEFEDRIMLVLGKENTIQPSTNPK